MAKTFLNLNNKCCLKPPDCANQVCVSASKLPNYIQMLSVQQSVYNNKDVSKGLHIKLQTYNYRKWEYRPQKSWVGFKANNKSIQRTYAGGRFQVQGFWCFYHYVLNCTRWTPYSKHKSRLTFSNFLILVSYHTIKDNSYKFCSHR